MAWAACGLHGVAWIAWIARVHEPHGSSIDCKGRWWLCFTFTRFVSLQVDWKQIKTGKKDGVPYKLYHADFKCVRFHFICSRSFCLPDSPIRPGSL